MMAAPKALLVSASSGVLRHGANVRQGLCATSALSSRNR